MYTNSTTHYGFPLPLGTDLTVPMDYNQAMNDIDENLFDAATDAETAATAAANAVETANGAAADVADLGTTVNAHDGRLTSLEQHDIVQDNKIDALETSTGIKFDSVGVADAYINGLTYDVDDIVTYNGQRYKCITAVTAAEPFDSDKWQGEDIQTVFDAIYSELTPVDITAQCTIAASITVASLKIIKIGKVLHVNGAIASSNTGLVAAITLPNDIEFIGETDEQQFFPWCRADATGNGYVAAGQDKIYFNANTTSNMMFNATFVLK